VVLNIEIVNIALIIGADVQITISCTMIQCRILLSTITSFLYSHDVETCETHFKCFRVTIFVNTAECTQRLLTCPTFMNQRSFSVSFVFVLITKYLGCCCERYWLGEVAVLMFRAFF